MAKPLKYKHPELVGALYTKMSNAETFRVNFDHEQIIDELKKCIKLAPEIKPLESTDVFKLVSVREIGSSDLQKPCLQCKGERKSDGLIFKFLVPWTPFTEHLTILEYKGSKKQKTVTR